jgi:hypothetical protein
MAQVSVSQVRRFTEGSLHFFFAPLVVLADFLVPFFAPLLVLARTFGKPVHLLKS